MKRFAAYIKNFWLVAAAIAFIDLFLFLAMILLLHPMWFNINEGLEKMLQVRFSWLTVIVILLLMAISFILYLMFRVIKAIENSEMYSLSVIQKAVCIIVTVIFTVLFYLLISGVEQEISTAWRELEKIFGSLVFLFLLAVVMFKFPGLHTGVLLKYRIASFLAVVLVFLIIENDYSSPEITAGPYLQRVTATSATIVWAANRKSLSWLKIEGGEFNKTFQKTEDGMFILKKIHRITIKNLKPGKKYSYQVFVKPLKQYYAYHVDYDQTLSSDKITFTTLSPDAERVSFLVFNDIHEQSDLIPAFIKKNPLAFDYLFINGDYFDHIDSKDQIIEQMLKPLDSVLKGSKPFYLVRGNHETRGIAAPKLKKFINQKGDKFYYAFSHGPVRFVVLDAGEDKTSSHEEYGGMVNFKEYRLKQLKWLIRETKSREFRQARYRIVLTHIPPFVDREKDRDHGQFIMNTKFAPVFEKNSVDLVLAGHTHKTAVFNSNENHSYPVVVGGSRWDGETVIKVDADMKNMRIAILNSEGKEVKALTVK